MFVCPVWFFFSSNVIVFSFGMCKYTYLSGVVGFAGLSLSPVNKNSRMRSLKMSVEEGKRREALGLFVFLPPKPKELQLFCSELIGDPTGDMQWEPSCPSRLTETAGHCPQTKRPSWHQNDFQHLAINICRKLPSARLLLGKALHWTNWIVPWLIQISQQNVQLQEADSWLQYVRLRFKHVPKYLRLKHWRNYGTWSCLLPEGWGLRFTLKHRIGFLTNVLKDQTPWPQKSEKNISFISLVSHLQVEPCLQMKTGSWAARVRGRQ